MSRSVKYKGGLEGVCGGLDRGERWELVLRIAKWAWSTAGVLAVLIGLYLVKSSASVTVDFLGSLFSLLFLILVISPAVMYLHEVKATYYTDAQWAAIYHRRRVKALRWADVSWVRHSVLGYWIIGSEVERFFLPEALLSGEFESLVKTGLTTAQRRRSVRLLGKARNAFCLDAATPSAVQVDSETRVGDTPMPPVDRFF